MAVCWKVVIGEERFGPSEVRGSCFAGRLEDSGRDSGGDSLWFSGGGGGGGDSEGGEGLHSAGGVVCEGGGIFTAVSLSIFSFSSK